MAAIILAALDIGGSKMAASIANENGPLARVVQATVKTGATDAIGQQALRLIAVACAEAGIEPASISRVGVSSCGPFAHEQQALGLVSPNLCGGLIKSDTYNEDLPNDWTFIPLEAVLRNQFADVVIDNDCVAALTAERCFGAAQEEPNAVYVTWSTGIGFGLCVDGHILRGKHGNAGHAGHMVLDETSDAVCGCGNRGDLEALVSGRNLQKRHGRSAADIFAAAVSGDTISMGIVQEAARWLGRGLYNLAATLDTRCFLMGGSVWRHHSALLAPLVESEMQSQFPALTEGVQIMGAALDDLVTDIGAFALVMPAEWMPAWRTRQPWNGLRTRLLD